VPHEVGVNDLQLRALGSELSERQRRLTALRDDIIREMNAAGVTLYIMNTEGLSAPADLAGVRKTPMTTPPRAEVRSPE